jgi:hypothetical protein
MSMGVKNFVFPNLPIVYDVCTNNISVEGTICCTVEESGALHNKNNEKSIISNPQIEQDCVIEDGVFHDNLSTNSIALVFSSTVHA